MTSIEVAGLTKRFGPVAAVTDLTFTVPPGAVTGFLGPNGAGKTTTMRMILGLVAPTAGSGLRAQIAPGRVVGTTGYARYDGSCLRLARDDLDHEAPSTLIHGTRPAGNGLDPAGVSWLRRLLAGLAAEGRTVLVSSHVLAEMEQLADRLVVIAGGRLLAAGTRAELAPAGLEGAFLRLTSGAA